MSEVIVITSGKGGVGKTTTTANVGTGLAKEGKKVVLIDTDIGLRNLDVVMGLENRIVYNLVDVVEGNCRIKQAMIKDKKYPNLFLLPSAQTRDKTSVTPEQMVKLVEELKDEFEKKRIKVDDLGFLELSISNTLSEDIDINVLRDKVGVIFANTKNTETVIKYSQSEGGTGLYKLYKTFQYNIDAAYAIWYQIEENLFGISVFIGITNIMA